MKNASMDTLGVRTSARAGRSVQPRVKPTAESTATPGIKWIELENTFLTDQPAIWEGRGRSRRSVPDPSVPPKEAWLFVWHCSRGAKGIKRKRGMEVLNVTGFDDLDQKLLAFCDRPDVIVIEDAPHDYASYRGEPKRAAETQTPTPNE